MTVMMQLKDQAQRAPAPRGTRRGRRWFARAGLATALSTMLASAMVAPASARPVDDWREGHPRVTAREGHFYRPSVDVRDPRSGKVAGAASGLITWEKKRPPGISAPRPPVVIPTDGWMHGVTLDVTDLLKDTRWVQVQLRYKVYRGSKWHTEYRWVGTNKTGSGTQRSWSADGRYAMKDVHLRVVTKRKNTPTVYGAWDV